MNNLMDLRKNLNKIRNILRNVGITDSDSIYHCISFILLRRLTPTICKNLDIPEDYAFKNFEESLDDEELRNKFWTPTGECFVFFSRKKLGYSFKFNTQLGNLHFRQVFNELKKIDFKELQKQHDVVGTIYELHLATGSKSSRDLGQYFTHRLVTKFMVALAKPIIQENGQIETIVDPTMGTGGFLSMAVEYLNMQGKVDWNKNKYRVFGYDIASHLTEMASINLLFETGKKFPYMITKDTLSKDMTPDEKPLKYDVILANEPMGLKGLKYANFCDRIKELKINGTKAEPAFLQLMMQSLNVGGRCVVVVPDGVLFATSKQHVETRKYMIDNFEVKEIIKMNDKNFFMNTGVSASIIFFTNPEERTGDKVKFSEISLTKDLSDLVYKEVVEVDYEKIVENNYSINPNIYQNDREIIEHAGYEYKTLGEICEFDKKSRRKASDGGNTGKYDFFTSSQLIKKCDDADYNRASIIIGTGGNPNINFSEIFSCSGDTAILYSKNESCILKYIFYYLKNNINILVKGFVGTGLKHISKDYIKNIKVPIPHLQKQREIVEQLDILSESNTLCKGLVEKLKLTFNIQMGLFTKSCDEYKTLGELCELKIGRFNSKDCNEDGLYPFFTSKANNPSGYSDKYCFDHPEYLILTKDGGAGKGKYGDQIGMGSIYKVSGKSGATSHQVALILKDNQVDYNYLYYYLKHVKNKIMDLANYTTGLGTIKTSTLSTDIKVPIPHLQKQQEIISYMDSLFSEISISEKRIEHNDVMMKEIIKLE